MKLKPEVKQNRDVQIIIMAALFYASACLGYFLTFDNAASLPTWPPSGVAFALILLMGSQVWPGITIGALLANLLSHWNDPTLPAHSVIAISAFTAISQTVEALIGNWLVKNWIKDNYPFKTSRSTFQFLFIAITMCLAGSVMGTIVLYNNDVISTDAVLKTCISWLVGNVVGVLLFTPFILSIVRNNQIKFSAEKALEVTLFLLGAIGIIFLLQEEYFSATIQRALPFMILPFFLWLAFRFE
ncbi:MAG TPA: MASE1 domain-containing protein, partial [Chryseosolibacter sp.]|nr:MASE1 domain-containing protein [Chryseosolibacter sp.]